MCLGILMRVPRDPCVVRLEAWTATDGSPPGAANDNPHNRVFGSLSALVLTQSAAKSGQARNPSIGISEVAPVGP